MKTPRKINIPCPQCRKMFCFYPSHPRKFCSQKCKLSSNSKNFKCENCFNEFSLKNFVVRKREGLNGTPKFCKRKCYNEYWKKNKIESQCMNCKNKFKQTLWESKNYRFCSSKCKSIYLEIGKSARSYKNGLSIYQRIGIGAWGNKCFHCQSTDNIEIHHLDKNRKHNTPENLRPLCRKCHHAVHKSGLVLNI